MNGIVIPHGAELESLCVSCHNPTGQASAMTDVANHIVDGGLLTLDCGCCHDPHGPTTPADPHPGGQIADNLSLVREDTSRYVPGALEPALFQVAPDHFAFAEADPPWNGICQSCHTQTAHHTQDGSGDHSHMIGTDCVTCHPHVDGFEPSSACNACHGSTTNNAPPVDTGGSSDTGDVTVGAHQSHLTDGLIAAAFECGECHVVPLDIGEPTHIDSVPAELDWGSLADDGGALLPIWDRVTETCSDVYCHGTTVPGGFIDTPTWTVVNGSQAGCGTCHSIPPPAPHTTMTSCYLCHGGTMDSIGQIDIAGGLHVNGVVDSSISGACDSCHGAAPATGAHAVHFGATPTDASYGGTGSTADLLPAGGAYAFDCGNCHPIDAAQHANGVLNAGGAMAQVELDPAGAPPGSLKAENDPGAGYTPGGLIFTDAQGFTYTLGSCDGVYCHSTFDIETPDPPPAVPAPGVDFPFTGYPMTYPPYTVSVLRVYANPVWSDGTSCDSCHGMPPRTYDPATVAGAGDSHSWIDDQGSENLHGWNMYGAWYDEPVACASCHFDTVVDQGVRYYDGANLSVYEPIAIDDHLDHVDGSPDVAFTTDVVYVGDSPQDLTTASFDDSTATCDSVECHINQTPVQWGTPYRSTNFYECNVCHQM